MCSWWRATRTLANRPTFRVMLPPTINHLRPPQPSSRWSRFRSNISGRFWWLESPSLGRPIGPIGAESEILLSGMDKLDVLRVSTGSALTVSSGLSSSLRGFSNSLRM
jgi:hypothetical protein